MKPSYFAKSLQEWDEQTGDWAFVGYTDDVWDLIDLLTHLGESLDEWQCYELHYATDPVKLEFPCITNGCENMNDWPEKYCEVHGA